MLQPNIHLLGIQGSGKGTQSALLVKKYGLTYASSGDLFRQRAAVGDAFGMELAQQMGAGKLLPDPLLFKTVDAFLHDHPVPKGFLGDGVIRTASQYHGLLETWQRHGLEQPLLVNLQLSEEIALERIEQRQRDLNDPEKYQHHLVYGGKLLKRADDNPKAIHERFAIFREMTAPVIEIFEAQERCLHVDANQPVEAIHIAVCAGIETLYPTLAHVPHKVG